MGDIFLVEDWSVIWWAIFWSATPMGELKLGIPYALLNDLDPVFAYFLCCTANLLSYPVTITFLNFAHKGLMKFKYYRTVINRLIERARAEAVPKIKKYGFLGISVFIMLPLPFTGAYMASLAAWIVNMDRRKAFVAVIFGSFFSGLLLTAVVQGGVEIFDFFMPKE